MPRSHERAARKGSHEKLTLHCFVHPSVPRLTLTLHVDGAQWSQGGRGVVAPEAGPEPDPILGLIPTPTPTLTPTGGQSTPPPGPHVMPVKEGFQPMGEI